MLGTAKNSYRNYLLYGGMVVARISEYKRLKSTLNMYMYPRTTCNLSQITYMHAY